MPPWFIDIESATEIEAKSKGTPPASRTASHACRANWPSSALHGVTRPSVDATPTNGLARSPSLRPSARRNARCGARSRPSTVTREGRIGMVFFVLIDDLLDVAAAVKPERVGARRIGRLRGAVHDLLQLRIRLEAHLALRPALHRVPHLLRRDRDSRKQDGPLRGIGLEARGTQERFDHP